MTQEKKRDEVGELGHFLPTHCTASQKKTWPRFNFLFRQRFASQASQVKFTKTPKEADDGRPEMKGRARNLFSLAVDWQEQNSQSHGMPFLSISLPPNVAVFFDDFVVIFVTFAEEENFDPGICEEIWPVRKDEKPN